MVQYTSMQVVLGFLGLFPFFWVLGGKIGVNFISISSSPVFATPNFELSFWNFRRCWNQPKL